MRDVCCDRESAAIARALIELCRVLDLHVVAEGVETRDQVAFLTEHGAHTRAGLRLLPAACRRGVRASCCRAGAVDLQTVAVLASASARSVPVRPAPSRPRVTAASASGSVERSPVARTLSSTTPSASPFLPTTTWNGQPMRSASLNFTPARSSRSSMTTSMPGVGKLAPDPLGDLEDLAVGHRAAGRRPRAARPRPATRCRSSSLCCSMTAASERETPTP